MMFDTDILIWVLRGHGKAAMFLAKERNRTLSQVSWMELVQGARDKRDLVEMRTFLARMEFRTLPLTFLRKPSGAAHGRPAYPAVPAAGNRAGIRPDARAVA